MTPLRQAEKIDPPRNFGATPADPAIRGGMVPPVPAPVLVVLHKKSRTVLGRAAERSLKSQANQLNEGGMKKTRARWGRFG